MSKYIIDLRPDCKVVQQICASNENVNVGARSVGLLDALTDDYIKENFKYLLDAEYQRGLEEGKKATFGLVADASNAEYQKGLNDAWECARKIVCDESCGGMSMKELVEIFNKSSDAYILRDFTAQQAIEMLKAYKQKKDGKIEVGDEVADKDGNKTIVTNIHGDLFDGLCSDGSTMMDLFLDDTRKTGRHFDIPKILEDMRHD